MTNQFSVIKTFTMRCLINAYKKLLSLKKALISSSALIRNSSQPQLVNVNKAVTNQKSGNKVSANLESHSIQTRTVVEESQPESASDNDSNNISSPLLMIVLTRIILINLILPLRKIRYILAILRDGISPLTKPRNC